MSDIEERHRKQVAAMRVWLESRGYFTALKAFELVRKLEQGFRKDGKTPKFDHQLSIAQLICTFVPRDSRQGNGHLIHPEETIAVCFLHDVLEDHKEWTVARLEAYFGKLIADAVWLLSKKMPGLKKEAVLYFGELGTCPIASIVKPADRCHNLQTMQGVFTYEKQRLYIEEVEERFYPFIKTARRDFPQQYQAYANLLILMRCQCSLIRHIHKAAQQSASAHPGESAGDVRAKRVLEGHRHNQ